VCVKSPLLRYLIAGRKPASLNPTACCVSLPFPAIGHSQVWRPTVAFSYLADLVQVKVKRGTLLFTNNPNVFMSVSKATVNVSRLSWSFQFAQCSHSCDAVVVARRRRAAHGKTSRGQHSLRRPASLTATMTACPTPRYPAMTPLGSLLVLSTPRHLLSFLHLVVTTRVCSVPRHGACRHWRRAVKTRLVLIHNYGPCCY